VHSSKISSHRQTSINLIPQPSPRKSTSPPLWSIQIPKTLPDRLKTRLWINSTRSGKLEAWSRETRL